MNGEKYTLEFYRKGFFGYGKEGEFRPWSFSHFAMFIILAAGIVPLALFGAEIRDWAGEEKLRCALAMLMMLCEFGYLWRLLYVGPETHEKKTMIMRLPLQVCNWTALLVLPMLFLKSKLLLSMVFYLSLTCGMVALCLPLVITTTGPSYFRYYHFCGEHILPIWSVFYLIFVHGIRPSPIGILLMFCMLFVMAPLAAYFNKRYDECNFLYLKPEKYPLLKQYLRINSAFGLKCLYGVIVAILCLIVQSIYQLILSALSL
jgi:hypothetical integral membrane protein (TIGR02206 family)